MCKLFSIYSKSYCLRRHAGDLRWRRLLEDSPHGPVERMYRDARAMWLWRKALRNVQRITIARNRQKFWRKRPVSLHEGNPLTSRHRWLGTNSTS